MGYKKLQEKIPLRGHHKITIKYDTRAMYVYLNILLVYKDVQHRKPKSTRLSTLERETAQQKYSPYLSRRHYQK